MNPLAAVADSNNLPNRSPTVSAKRRRRVQPDASDTTVRRILNWPTTHIGVFTGVLVVLGIAWDYKFGTAYSTSKYDLRPKVAEHVWYFADKRNFLNRIFVKQATAWTTFVFLIPHAIFSPSRSHHPYFPSKAQRVLEISLYLLAWYIVTEWMTSYVRTASGAICQLPVPPQVIQNPSFVGLSEIDDHPIVRTDGTGAIQAGNAFISVPFEYCNYQRKINPTAFPELFSFLKPKTKQLAEEGLYKASTLDISNVRARFFEGFDISGHVFLLFASMAMILRQVAPALKMLYDKGKLVDAPSQRISQGRLAGHALSIVGGLGLVVIWSFMLWTTSAYFHTNPEKLAGYAVGVLAIACIHTISRFASLTAPNYFPRHA